MRQIISILASIIALLISFSTASADGRNLVEIANDYTSEFMWGTELGEAPLVYSISSIAEYEDRLNELQRNLDRINELGSEHQGSQLWLDLRNFTEQELFVLRSCQPGVWDYVEAYQLMFFFDDIIYRLQQDELVTEDTSLIDRSIETFTQILRIYTEKIQVSIERQLLPSSSSFILSTEDATAMGISLTHFSDFLQNYQSEICTDCEIDTAAYEQKYNSEIQPLVDLFFESLTEVRELATHDTVIVPSPIRESCYTAVMGSVGSETLSPQEVLELGLNELSRVETLMFEIIATQIGVSQNIPAEQKLSIINEYMTALSSHTDQFFNNPEDYIAYVRTWVQKGMDILPTITSLGVGKPGLEDMNYESPSSPGALYSTTDGNVLINSKTPYPKYSLPSLIGHEGVPGHHLERQLALGQATETEFEQHVHPNDFIEGWAFYMEEYLDEASFYESDLQRLGYLDDIRIRALRLILPYRFYFEGWTENQAREFSTQHSSMPEFRLNNELGRNQHWRGQVLGYMIGKASIIKMKNKAKTELGNKYNDKGFHDFLLSHGNVNLRSLQTMLSNWIASQK